MKVPFLTVSTFVLSAVAASAQDDFSLFKAFVGGKPNPATRVQSVPAALKSAQRFRMTGSGPSEFVVPIATLTTILSGANVQGVRVYNGIWIDAVTGAESRCAILWPTDADGADIDVPAEGEPPLNRLTDASVCPSNCDLTGLGMPGGTNTPAASVTTPVTRGEAIRAIKRYLANATIGTSWGLLLMRETIQLFPAAQNANLRVHRGVSAGVRQIFVSGTNAAGAHVGTTPVLFLDASSDCPQNCEAVFRY